MPNERPPIRVVEPFRPSVLSSIFWALFMTTAHAVAIVAVAGAMAWIVPTFTNHFEQLDIELPLLTLQCIEASMYVSAYWWIAVVLLPIDTLIMFGLNRLPTAGRWLSHVWAVGLLVAAIIAIFAVLLGMAMPFMEMDSALGA